MAQCGIGSDDTTGGICVMNGKCGHRDMDSGRGNLIVNGGGMWYWFRVARILSMSMVNTFIKCWQFVF